MPLRDAGGGRSTTVAVIITCYNLGRFLDEAVDSVLAQTYQDFEIIIVDDGSTEPQTCGLLKDYRRPKTRVIRSENRGLSGARNLGIRSSSSPYVTTLDADDRFTTDMLEKSVAALDADYGLGFASHWLRTFGDEKWEWRPERCDLAAMVDANAINGAALMRRECFDTAGGFDEQMRDGCEDWDFWLTAMEAGVRGTIIPEVLYEYRRRPESMSRLMMEGDRHAQLFAHLARKHLATFRRHLPDALARREREIVNFRRHLHDLEHEHINWLQPEVSRHRDDVAMLQRAADAAVVNATLSAQLEDATRRAMEANQNADALREAMDRIATLELAWNEARQVALERDAGFNRLQSEITALKQSASWRITAPLRALFGSAGRFGRSRA